MDKTTKIRIAAATTALGIALGAFGAHGREATLEANDRVANWETATLYHLIHGLAMFVVAMRSRAIGYFWFLGGILLFSGSLYILALTNITKLGAITPFGGTAFLIGWASWIFAKKIEE